MSSVITEKFRNSPPAQGVSAEGRRPVTLESVIYNSVAQAATREKTRLPTESKSP